VDPTNPQGPWLSDDGLDLYYSSGTGAGMHADVIYLHRDSQAGTFANPLPVLLQANAAGADPYLSADQLMLWFNNFGSVSVVRRADRSAVFMLSDAQDTLGLVTGTVDHPGSLSFSVDGKRVVYQAKPDSAAGTHTDLYTAVVKDDMTFSDAAPLIPPSDPNLDDCCGAYELDGSLLYSHSSNADIYRAEPGKQGALFPLTVSQRSTDPYETRNGRFLVYAWKASATMPGGGLRIATRTCE
jgi:hypothetical protein